MKKRYLGDAVYVDFVDDHLMLTVENGCSITGPIFLNEDVFRGLKIFVEDMNHGTDIEKEE